MLISSFKTRMNVKRIITKDNYIYGKYQQCVQENSMLYVVM